MTKNMREDKYTSIQQTLKESWDHYKLFQKHKFDNLDEMDKFLERKLTECNQEQL